MSLKKKNTFDRDDDFIEYPHSPNTFDSRNDEETNNSASSYKVEDFATISEDSLKSTHNYTRFYEIRDNANTNTTVMPAYSKMSPVSTVRRQSIYDNR
jgi:hypothetical protein